jgi:hypothetical protein
MNLGAETSVDLGGPSRQRIRRKALHLRDGDAGAFGHLINAYPEGCSSTESAIVAVLQPLDLIVRINHNNYKIHWEGYAKLSLKKYRPIAARNEDRKVFNGLL